MAVCTLIKGLPFLDSGDLENMKPIAGRLLTLGAPLRLPACLMLLGQTAIVVFVERNVPARLG